jgi:adenosylcobinamide-GDP ribazoletransferase
MKNEIRVFFTALMFYTRIPCPKWVDHSEEFLNKATRYFPLIGWIVGFFSAFIFWTSSIFFSKEISLILSMITSIFITGAFHEDGFADVCDGFGGGWTKEKILLIMKDSRVGAYGAIGISLLLLLKFFLLLSINTSLIPFCLIAAHALSRWSAATFIFTHTYSRDDDSSKSKPVANNITLTNLLIATFLGVLPLISFKSIFIFLIILPVYITKFFLGRYFKKWIGGYTGDCLGATQQLTEIIFYLSFIILWKYI